MPNVVEYAQFAANAYARSKAVVNDVNIISVPSNWRELIPLETGNNPGENNATGFLARAYKNDATGEIVIAYAGTTFEDGMKAADWMNGNIPAGTGFGLGGQVADAAKFYLDILSAPGNANAQISFTGHSLGGGLASLMAVYFNRPAETFDQAPFGRSAVSQAIYDALKDRLIQLNCTLPTDFTSYVPGSDMSGRKGLVGETHIKGEAMQLLQNPLVTGGLVTAIGGVVGGLAGLALTPYNIARSATDGEKDIGISGLPFTGSVALHDMPLLVAVLQSDKFRQACLDNPGFLQQIFDSKFYSTYLQKTEDHSFFNLMVQQEIAGNKPLDALANDIAKFTGDLDPVASDKAGADGALKSALHALAVALYYDEAQSRTGVENNPIVSLFESVSGGIRFALNPNFAADYGGSLDSVMEQLKLYFPEVRNYLNAEADRFTLPTTGAILASSIADDKRDLMLGSRQNDNLEGGGGSDVLLGLNGEDTLDGGTDADSMVGGDGDDTYYVDDPDDVVTEKAGEGTDTVYASVDYDLSANVEKLILTGSDAIHGTGDDTGNEITGNDGANDIDGGGGNDTLIGGAGADTLHGDDGAGGDILEGGLGADTYHADEGDTIRDADGKGTVYLNGKQLTLATRKKGETAYKDATGNTYILTGTTLLVNDPLVIENFTSGDLGIELKEELDDDDPDDPALKDPFQKAEATKSPLVLDLDGNGISTRGIGEGAFFDYDGDGFAERTGWIDAGDALLVRDLDGDGKIGTGSELFGNHTQLKDGTLAANGYAALTDLDDNGDGQLDSQDAAFAELKVWQDVDSDGLADTTELKTLVDAGIQSIATAYTGINITDAHDNQHLQQGSFTRTDDSTALVEDIWFRINAASTRPDNPLDIPAEIRALPQVQGMGNVASLWQVMAQQQADGSSQLKDLIGQFAAEPDLVARQALTVKIIYAWTEVEDKDPLSRAQTRYYGNAIGDARKLYAMEALLGEGYEGTWCWGEKDPNPHGPAAAVLLKAFDQFANGITAQLMQQTRLEAAYQAINYSIDPQTQDIIGDLSGVLALFGDKIAANREQGKAELVAFITNLTYTNKLGELDTQTFQEGLAAYGADVVSVANMAWRGMVATRGNDQLTGDNTHEIIAGWDGNDLIQGGGGNDHLLGEIGDDRLYGQDGDDTLAGGVSNDLLDGGAGNDTYLFGRGDGQDTIWSQDGTVGKQDVLKVGAGVTAADIDLRRNADDLILTIRDTGDRMTVAGYFANDGTASSRLDAIEFDDGLVWDFAAVKDMLPPIGTGGNDRIRGYEAAEAIDGLDGNDVIEGLGGNDVLVGGAGNDTLDGGIGNDTLDGGIGNDLLDGGAGNDTYLFGRGDGQDTISSNDGTQTKQDAVQFKSGVSASDVTASRQGDSLVLAITDTQDRLTIQNYFSNDGSFNSYGVEAIRFDDGTSWSYADIKPKVLVWTEGNDVVLGYTTDDALEGLGGNDTLYGQGGNDTLDGGTGNDQLDGGNGNDTYLFGRGDGQDTISSYNWAQTKQDVVKFKAGISASDVTASRQDDSLVLAIAGTQDRLTIQNYFSYDGSFNPYGVEAIRFDDGTSWSYADIKPKVLVGTEGKDVVYGYTTDDALEGLGGNDTLYGQGGNDTLDGGIGSDLLDGGAGNDTYLFGRGDGQDTISSYDWTQTKQDVVQFKAGVSASDVTASRQGDSLILAITGTQDRLTIQNYFYNDGSFNSYGVEAIRFDDGTSWSYADIKPKVLVWTEGNDVVYGYTTDDALEGLGGNDALYGQGGNDTLDGGTGSDYLNGGYGNDTYLFGTGSGQDNVIDYGGNVDTVKMAAGVHPEDVKVTRDASHLYLSLNGGADRLMLQNWFSGNSYQIEQVVFDDGTTWDAAALWNKANAATEAADYVYGTAGDDSLVGLGGNDTLDGDTGNDTLDGGTGNDYLNGGQGNDTYLFGTGSGQDNVYDYDGEADTVKMAAGVRPEDVKVTRDASHLYLSLNGGADRLMLQNWFSSSAYQIEQVVFDDGTTWDAAALWNKANAATGAADYVGGTAGADSLVGLGGNDTLDGGSGNDTLDGGTGNDDLKGGYGNDTYLFGTGSGQDNVIDYDPTVGNVDTVKMAAGVRPEDVKVTRDTWHLYLSLNGGADGLTLQNWFSASAYQIEQVVFDDGTTWDTAALWNKANAVTEAADHVYGTVGDDSLVGLGGNDTLDGGRGNDTLDGGTGNDYLYGGYGNDTYLFGTGSGQDDVIDYGGDADKVRMAAGVRPEDVKVTRDASHLYLSLNGGADRLTLRSWFSGSANQIEQVVFDDGTTWDTSALWNKANAVTEAADYVGGTAGDDSLVGLGGNDTLDGGSGNDTLDGGTGNDDLKGGYGNDTYLFGTGSGQDNVYDYDPTTGNVDTVKMAAGVRPEDVKVTRDTSYLYLSLNGGADRLALQNWFSGSANQIEQVVFDDGTTWDTSALWNKANAVTEAADYVYGTVGDDSLVGLGGNDTLDGRSGNDTLDGGSGNDQLVGGYGNDTYLFGLSSGQDSVSDHDTTAGNLDSVRLAAGIKPKDVKVTRDASYLYLSLNGGADRLTLQNWFSGSAYQIERVVFDDETTWDASALWNKANAVTEAADYVGGTAGDDSLVGLGGNDTLDGGSGNDTLDGGTGSDMLYGGYGNDTYLFGAGSGQDNIYDPDSTAGNFDKVRMAAGVHPEDVKVTRSASDLYLSLNDGADRLMLQFWFSGNGYQIEQVVFDDGTTWDASALWNKANAVTEAADYVYGTAGDDSLVGLGGNDTLDGGSGNDTLDGGTGSDMLYGGYGNDTYLFGAGSGQDNVIDDDPTVGNVDTVRMAVGVRPDQVKVTRDASVVLHSV